MGPRQTCRLSALSEANVRVASCALRIEKRICRVRRFVSDHLKTRMLRCVRTETSVRGTEGWRTALCLRARRLEKSLPLMDPSFLLQRQREPSRGIKIWHYYGYYAVIINYPLLPPFQHRQTITHANITRSSNCPMIP